MKAEDRAGRSVVTGALTEYHDGKMSPPDARVSHRRFYDVGSLIDGIIERLKRREKVTVTLYPRDSEATGEKHDVHLSD